VTTEHERRVVTVQEALGTTREDAEKIVEIAGRRMAQTGVDVLPAMIAMMAGRDWRREVDRWAQAWKLSRKAAAEGEVQDGTAL